MLRETSGRCWTLWECLQITKRQLEIDVRFDDFRALPAFLRGETDVKRVFVGADLGYAVIVATEPDAQHLRNAARHHLLVNTLDRGLR